VRRSIRAGGVYLGVGPEQNFTYIVGFEPKMAFIVDIRRLNMLEHLLYKALMELSADRAEFLSRLFSRPRSPLLHSDSSAEALVSAYEEARPSELLFEANSRLAIDYLVRTKGFALKEADEEGVRYVHRAFLESGPNMSYTFIGGYRGAIGMPTYGELMTEDDGRARNWNFLATEDQYRAVQRLQKDNLIVPLVGDFAGPNALRSIASYLRDRKAHVTVFYTSNVEQYLFQDDENWRRFYANIGALPIQSSSVFVRYVLNSWRFGRRSRSVYSGIEAVTDAYEQGRIRSYYDVIAMSD
jgi:hypothetical protein